MLENEMSIYTIAKQAMEIASLEEERKKLLQLNHNLKEEYEEKLQENHELKEDLKKIVALCEEFRGENDLLKSRKGGHPHAANE